MVRKLLEPFVKKKLQKKVQNFETFEIEKIIRKKAISDIFSGKVMITRLTARYVKNISLYKVSFYPKQIVVEETKS